MTLFRVLYMVADDDAMYFLNFHIDKKAAQLIRLVKFLLATEKASRPSRSSFEVELGNFILMVEGFQKHVAHLSPEEAQTMLESTQKVIKQVYNIRDSLKMTEEGGKEAMQSKLKYAIKVLNRLEAMLHVGATKGLPVEKTPEHIKQGLSHFSQEAIAHSLSKS